jgi:hypothetical protein
MLIISKGELREKEATLAAKIDPLLPDFVKSCREKADGVIIHQDSFAADY